MSSRRSVRIMPECKRIVQSEAILEKFVTPEAVEIIQRVVGGKDHAAPTKFARKTLDRMK